MITEARGNLLDADVDALVNTVNTVGVMGKGIALQFKRAYPDMFDAYVRAAKAGEIQLGQMHVWPTNQLTGPRYVINFPTKGHWKASSKIKDIDVGLVDLVRVLEELKITSVAIPPLGCGNGGLQWTDVEPRIRQAMRELPDVNVILFPPGTTPSAQQMRTATAKPGMTPARAALIKLMTCYSERSLDVSQIEIQKLLYFLQVAGEPLRLQFVKGYYGPYADNLRHALVGLEGHYLVGFGDGSGRIADAEPLRVLQGAEDEADEALSGHPETHARIARVLALGEGFESAYGMELLATVHWLAHSLPSPISNASDAARMVGAWSPRKERMFTEAHVTAAWNALLRNGWLMQPHHPARDRSVAETTR